MTIVLGENAFGGKKYPVFLDESLVKESLNLGCFTIENNNPDYILELTIDSCKTEVQYELVSEVIFGLLFYVMFVNEITYPVLTRLQINAKLFHNQDLLYEHTYRVNREDFANFEDYPKRDRRAKLLGLMVSSLSSATKDMVPVIIEDINRIIDID